MLKSDKKVDQAARAAWMYYIAGKTQHQIAESLGVSRQVAQRLVAMASDQGLVSVHINHPVATCTELAEQLKEQFGLSLCRVVPSQNMDDDALNRMIAVEGAEVMGQFVKRDDPLTIALGSGRTLRATINELAAVERPQHSCVSLIGAIASDGACTRYDVPLWMAEKTQGRYFILPAPLFADNEEDCELWCNHRIYQIVKQHAEVADVSFIGIGNVGYQCPLHADGFISSHEVKQLSSAHIVAEIVGNFIDENGQHVPTDMDCRLTSIRVQPDPQRPVIAFAGGSEKRQAIRAVVNGQWLNGLVTDEDTARYLLS